MFAAARGGAEPEPAPKPKARAPPRQAAPVPAARDRPCSRPSPKAPLAPLGENPAVSSRPPIEERFARPSVMGVVNVTPDSFSDGGVHLRAGCGGRRPRCGMLDEGAAIIDVGGESTRPGSDGVPLDEELRRVVPVLEALAGAPVSIDTAKAGGRAPGARARRRARQRRDGAARRPASSPASSPEAGCVRLPDAHAGRAADDAGRPALRRRRLRGEGVPRGAARASRSRRGSARSSSASTPGSGSGRRSSTTSSSSAGCRELVAIGRPVVVGFSRKSTLARLLGDPSATVGTHGGVGRRGGRGVRARGDDPPRARRPRARRGAARGAGGVRAR